MNLSALILKLAGWKVEVNVPDAPKCIICVAPHTSNWDFILGKLAYSSVGRSANFLMKSDWFFFPLGIIFRAMGGIPVNRKVKNGSLVDTIVDMFAHTDKLQIAITPEGTRSRVSKWKTGFLRISLMAKVPCQLAAIDYKNKRIAIDRTFYPTDDINTDMEEIKKYYRNFTGKHPEKFSTDPQEII